MPKKLTLDQFIKKARKIHGNKYNYSKVIYINSWTKICIICPIHGEFWQTPNNHLNNKQCFYCYGRRLLSHEQWIIQFNNKNIIFLSQYTGMNNKIKCQCLTCFHIWENTPAHLKCGQGCPKCANYLKHTQLQIEETIYKINPNIKILGSYINDYTQLKYQCKKCHHIHSATPSNLKRGFGCPYCNNSKGENIIEKWLKENKIKYKIQKRFKNCKNIRSLPFDFWLYKLNILIEYDGQQHFKPIAFNGSSINKAKLNFKNTKRNDKIKNKYCKLNHITLIRIPYWDLKNINTILKSKLS